MQECPASTTSPTASRAPTSSRATATRSALAVRSEAQPAVARRTGSASARSRGRSERGTRPTSSSATQRGHGLSLLGRRGRVAVGVSSPRRRARERAPARGARTDPVGRLGGTLVLALPWVQAQRPPGGSREQDRDRPRRAAELRIGEPLTARASRAVETSDRVSCIVPGHHRPGTELYADELLVADDPFEWELAGNCAFVSDFDYSSDD